MAILGLACHWPAAANAQLFLPTIKSEVGSPVLQELMGGCSLRCAFSWETVATEPGRPAHPVYALDDNDASTAWIDGSAVPGTKLEFRFPKKLPPDLNNTPFYGFDIADGFIKPLEKFKAYARVKKLKFYYNGKPLYNILLADTWRWQKVTFKDINAREGDIVTMEVLEVYPGEKFPYAAITELILQGAH